MYYIDAIESQMALFDFPEIYPATEAADDSQSSGIGSKLAKIVKWCVKKIKEFVKKIIALVKSLLGNSGPNEALKAKKETLALYRQSIRPYLPDKDVTDLTKIKGLSSYRGGESGPYISESQASTGEGVIEQVIDITIKEYSADLEAYANALSIISDTVMKSSQKLASLGSITRDIITEFRATLSDASEATSEVTKYRNICNKTYEDSKSKLHNEIESLVGKCSNFPEDVISLIKSIINSGVSRVKRVLRESHPKIKNALKTLDADAARLEKLADAYEKIANEESNAPNQDNSLIQAARDGSKIILQYSQAIYSSTAVVKNSSNGVVFEGATMPMEPRRKENLQKFKEEQEAKRTARREERREYLKNHPDDPDNHIGEIEFKDKRTGKSTWVDPNDIKTFGKMINDENMIDVL